MNAISKISETKRSLFDDWTYARPYLMSAFHMLDGLYTEEDLIAGVLSGHMKLWVGDKCAAITHIIQYPRGKVLNTLIAGAEIGCLENLIALGDTHMAYGAENGCIKIRVYGRKGWQKVFRDFEFNSITLTKDI